MCIILLFLGCAKLQEVVNQFPQNGGSLSQAKVSSGLRQALDFGIDKQITILTQKDGVFKNELVKLHYQMSFKK